MAQLRHDYQKFKALNTEVLLIVPNGPKMIEGHIKQNNTQYPILSDRASNVAAEYFQIKKFFLAGTPTVVLVDKGGRIGYISYVASLIGEPDNREPLAVLARL